MKNKSITFFKNFLSFGTLYIRRGLFCDDYYEPPVYTLDELIEIGNKAVERDKKNGIPPKKHNFDVFVGILDSED